MSKFLLFAGNNYYPGKAFQDFKGDFPTYKECLEHLLDVEMRENSFDWYQIVDRETLLIVKET